MVESSNNLKKFRFSVVIPTLDEEGVLDNLLLLFTRDLKIKYDFEVIVSDGGSSDKTVEIAKKYCEKVVEHPIGTYQTIGDGRNQGAYLAESDYLVFINADSYPKDIYVFLEFINDWVIGKGKYKKADAIAAKVEPIPKDKHFKDNFYYFIFNNYFNFLNIIGVGMGRGECQLVKKEIFNEFEGYNSTIAAGEDFDLFHRIAQKNIVKFANELVVYESPRRFRKKGYLNTILLWFMNSVSVWISGKSISKKWEKIR